MSEPLLLSISGALDLQARLPGVYLRRERVCGTSDLDTIRCVRDFRLRHTAPRCVWLQL